MRFLVVVPLGEIYWESKTKSQNTITAYNKLQPKAEMIFVYSKQEKRRFNLIKNGEKSYPLKDERGNYREFVLEVMNANGVRGRETMIFDISDGVATYKKAGDLFVHDGKVIIKMRPEYERNETTVPFWGFFQKSLERLRAPKKNLPS